MGNSSIDAQVLSRADFSAQPTNLTQDTRIAEFNISSLRDLPLASRGNPKF